MTSPSQQGILCVPCSTEPPLRDNMFYNSFEHLALTLSHNKMEITSNIHQIKENVID